MDLIEADGKQVTPVDYKRGRAPDTAEHAWEPERVQLCAQALILEENGYEKPYIRVLANCRRSNDRKFPPKTP